MKKAFTLCCALMLSMLAQAATYRTYVGHFIFGDTYTIYVNSDTAFGEDVIGQICYTPSGGGPTQYTGFILGSFDNTTVPGANWKVEITLPAGATAPLLELANENQSNQQYGWTGCNIALGNVLPVELTRLDAQKNGTHVMLSWATASEKNNERFVVERSSDSRFFEVIGEVKGAGTTQTAQFYQFEDRQPQKGTNYYRLQTIDTDGQSGFSHLVAIAFSSTAAHLVVAPNPVIQQLQVSFTLENDGPYTLEMVDALGKIAMARTGEGLKGDNILPLDASDLPSGLYCLRVNGLGIRVVKQ